MDFWVLTTHTTLCTSIQHTFVLGCLQEMLKSDKNCNKMLSTQKYGNAVAVVAEEGVVVVWWLRLEGVAQGEAHLLHCSHTATPPQPPSRHPQCAPRRPSRGGVVGCRHLEEWWELLQGCKTAMILHSP